MKLKGREEEDPGNNKVKEPLVLSGPEVLPRVKWFWMMVSLLGVSSPNWAPVSSMKVEE